MRLHPVPLRFVVTEDGKSMHLTHDSWAQAREHADYLHRCFPHQHIYGVTSFYKRWKY